LKSREESSAELRESLKEAVALLKPLQDAVAKAEDEKKILQNHLLTVEQERKKEATQQKQQLNQRNHQIHSLQDQVTSLEEQVHENKQLAAARQTLLLATSPATTPKSKDTTPKSNEVDSVTKIQRAREELRRKRETEGNLQQLLKDAQTRFHSLHQQNEDVAARNRELQGKLSHAEQQLGGNENSGTTLEEQLAHYQQQLSQKEKQVQTMRHELEQRRTNHTQLDSSQEQRIHDSDHQLSKTLNDLAQKDHAERILNKSLKEALGLLKPLQMHLEDAEREKMEISKELRNLRKRFRQLQMGDTMDDQSQSRSSQRGDVTIELVKIKEELEETVRQLELENSQLHDALEDLSGEDNNTHSEAKVRQQMVELNSRYEVTQNKLEDAHVENHALVKALKQKELEERQRSNHLRNMQDKLQKTENELNNAKAIARSALVKVEELTMANVEQLSLTRDGDRSLEMNMSLTNVETLSH
jgi:chromosome segregation ATPase